MARWRGWGLLLVGVLAVTGCTSGSADPPPSTAASSSVGSVTSPPVVPVPTMPAAATAHDAAGAQVFVTYWFAVVNYTFTTRDTALFRSLAQPECQFCADFAAKVDARRAKGEFYDGGSFTPTVVVTPGIDGSGLAVVDAMVKVAPSRVLDKQGTVLESDAGNKAMHVVVTLNPTPGNWLVEAADVQG